MFNAFHTFWNLFHAWYQLPRTILNAWSHSMHAPHLNTLTPSVIHHNDLHWLITTGLTSATCTNLWLSWSWGLCWSCCHLTKVLRQEGSTNAAFIYIYRKYIYIYIYRKYYSLLRYIPSYIYIYMYIPIHPSLYLLLSLSIRITRSSSLPQLPLIDFNNSLHHVVHSLHLKHEVPAQAHPTKQSEVKINRCLTLLTHLSISISPTLSYIPTH